MILSIIGDDTLANTTRRCCQSVDFEVHDRVVDQADLVWVCHDTPLAEGAPPDYQAVLGRIRAMVPQVKPETLILISSQLPVGTTRQLAQEFPDHQFGYSPENIRVKMAVNDFMHQARIVVGLRPDVLDQHRPTVLTVLRPFTPHVIFTDPESAEMVKHALNCYLGLSIAFANEIARVCKIVGADPQTVMHGVRTDPRSSLSAPLNPGAPFGGGHLARDIWLLGQLAEQHHLSLPIITHILESNNG